MCLNVDFKWLCDNEVYTCVSDLLGLGIMCGVTNCRRSFTVILFTCVVCCGRKVHCL